MIGIIGIAGALVLLGLAFGMLREVGSVGLDLEHGDSKFEGSCPGRELTSLATLNGPYGGR